MSTVITGTPGVGKHTVARAIAESLDVPMVDINQVAKESGLVEQGKTAGDVDVSKLAQILVDGVAGPSIIVGHLAPYVLSPWHVKKVIVLRRDPYELLRTYQERGYSDAKGMENAGSEVLGVIHHDAVSRFGGKAFQVMVSEESETARRVCKVMQGGQEDKVDWLDKVTRNGDLGKFFAY